MSQRKPSYKAEKLELKNMIRARKHVIFREAKIWQLRGNMMRLADRGTA